MQLAATKEMKETPLVAILPTGSEKSVVFIVLAMLFSSGITIVVYYRYIIDYRRLNL